MKAILFDLDGVFYEGERPLPGGGRVIAWARDKAIPHLFITNTSSRPRQALVEKLARMGIETDADHLLTPPLAAAAWLQANVDGPVALFVPEATREEFSALPEWRPETGQAAAAVVVGDLGEGWDFATLNRAFRLLMRKPPPAFVALGMTRYWKAADGLRLDTAPFVVALQHASGVEPLVLGKPAQPFFQAAADKLGLPAAECVMVGDDIRGDVEGAQRAGLAAVLVKTGKFRPQDLASGVSPDGVIDAIGDFPAWWEGRG